MRTRKILILFGLLSTITISSYAIRPSQSLDTTIYTISDTTVTSPLFIYKNILTTKESLHEFYKDSLKYPINQDCMAIVFVSLVIEKDASVSNFTILKDIPGCDEYMTEALRLVRLMNGLWKPALKDNLNVRYKIVVPVKFNEVYD
jgi:hypothetical protein